VEETKQEVKKIDPEKLVRVTFLPEGRVVEFEFGTMPYDHHGKPMSILDVAENFDRMDMAADQQLNSRLGCQAVITKPGNYVVEIPKWNRNYVSEGKPLTLADSGVGETSAEGK
jgi:2Fe-2S ferredoxin